MLNKKWLVPLVLILAIFLPTMALAAVEANISLIGDKTSFQPGDTVTMKLTIAGDPIQNIASVELTIGKQWPATLSVKQVNPVYDKEKGEIVLSFVVPKNFPTADDYCCTRLRMRAGGAWVNFQNSTNFPNSYFEVVNTTTPEFDAPKVESVTFVEDGQTLVPGDTITVKVKATDASKIAELGISMRGEGSTGIGFRQACQIGTDGVYTLTYTLPADTEPGVYKHNATVAVDEYDNAAVPVSFSTDAKITVVKGAAPIPAGEKETKVVASINAVENVVAPIAVFSGMGEKKMTLAVSEYKVEDVSAGLGSTVDEEKVKAYNLQLMIEDNGNYEYRPADTTTIYIPYPNGYNKDSEVTWELRHYNEKFTTYTTEKVEPTDKGLCATVKSFSPFALIWGTKAAPAPVVTEAPAASVPQTGDNTPIALLLFGMVASLAAITVIRRKKAC